MIRGRWLTAPVCLALLCGFTADEDPTYSDTIQPMLARSCVPCHHPGGESPFSLATYNDAKKRASLLRWVCIVGTMPPVDAFSELGELSALRKTSDQDLVELQEWVRTGAKEGKRTEETKVTSLPWRLSKFDLKLKPTNPGTVQPEGAPYRKLFVLKSTQLHGRSVTGFSLKGAAPLALRHAYLSVVPEKVDPFELFTPNGIDVQRVVGSWSPGHFAWHCEPGIAVPDGASLAVWALYQPTGRQESADFELECELGPPKAGPEWHSLGTKEFAIKPSDGTETLHDEWILDEPRKVVSIIPECKLYALQVRVTATTPDGNSKTLLTVRTWDRNWVGAYNFRSPVSLPKGTKITAEIDYDNSGHSAGNREVRPTSSVKFGPTDKDEHFWVHLQTVPDVP